MRLPSVCPFACNYRLNPTKYKCNILSFPSHVSTKQTCYDIIVWKLNLKMAVIVHYTRDLIFSVTGLLPVGLETAAQAPSMRRDQSPLMLYFSSWWESRCGSAQANKSADTGCGSVFQSIWERVWALRSWLDTKSSSEARLMKLHGAPQERFTEPFSREEIWNLL